MTDYPASAGLLLVRHGETEWSSSGRHTSTTDVALTPTGQEQAEAAGRALAGCDVQAALTSPLVRARETARLAGFADAAVDDDLVEWDYGPFEGRTTPEISEELGRPWTIWGAGSDGGEAPGESADRVGERVDRVFARLDDVLGAGGRAVLFAHGHVLRILAARWLRLPASEGARFALGTGTISRLGFEHGTRVVVHWNAVPHPDLVLD